MFTPGQKKWVQSNYLNEKKMHWFEYGSYSKAKAQFLHVLMMFTVFSLSDQKPHSSYWNTCWSSIWFVTVCGSTGLIPGMFAVFCLQQRFSSGLTAGGSAWWSDTGNSGLPRGLDLLLTGWSLRAGHCEGTHSRAHRQQRAPPPQALLLFYLSITSCTK